jgi:hypothetical protein
MRLLLSFIFTLFAAAANAALIIRGPYTEAPGKDSIVIRWQTDYETPAWVKYGPKDSKGACLPLVMTVLPAQTNHLLTLRALVPNTEFCYEVYVENAAGTGVQNPEKGTFKTLYTPERKIVKFLAIGNTSQASSDSEIKKIVARNMLDYDADFVAHTGNISFDGFMNNADTDFFRPFKDVLRKMPLLAALGEEEYGPFRTSQEGRGFLAANYKTIHTMPWSQGTPLYYYVDTANARILFLDTNNVYGALQAAPLTKNSSQYLWLKKSLESVESDKWKIVVMHHPVYSGQEDNPLKDLLSPLFEASKVNLVIQGNPARTAHEQGGRISERGPIYATVGESKFFGPEVPQFGYVEIIDRKLSFRAISYDNREIQSNSFVLRM